MFILFIIGTRSHVPRLINNVLAYWNLIKSSTRIFSVTQSSQKWSYAKNPRCRFFYRHGNLCNVSVTTGWISSGISGKKIKVNCVKISCNIFSSFLRWTMLYCTFMRLLLIVHTNRTFKRPYIGFIKFLCICFFKIARLLSCLWDFSTFGDELVKQLSFPFKSWS